MKTYAVKKIKISNLENKNKYWETVKNTSIHYCNGIKELREYVGFPLHYSKNANGYMGRNNEFEYVATEVK